MQPNAPSAPTCRTASRTDKLKALRALVLELLANKPHPRALLFARAIEAGFTDRAGLISGALALLEDDGLIHEHDGAWSLVQR